MHNPHEIQTYPHCLSNASNDRDPRPQRCRQPLVAVEPAEKGASRASHSDASRCISAYCLTHSRTTQSDMRSSSSCTHAVVPRCCSSRMSVMQTPTWSRTASVRLVTYSVRRKGLVTAAGAGAEAGITVWERGERGRCVVARLRDPSGVAVLLTALSQAG